MTYRHRITQTEGPLLHIVCVSEDGADTPPRLTVTLTPEQQAQWDACREMFEAVFADGHAAREASVEARKAKLLAELAELENQDATEGAGR